MLIAFYFGNVFADDYADFNFSSNWFIFFAALNERMSIAVIHAKKVNKTMYVNSVLLSSDILSEKDKISK